MKQGLARVVPCAGRGRGDGRCGEELRHHAGSAEAADADRLAERRETGGGDHGRARRHRADSSADSRDAAGRRGGQRAGAGTEAANRAGAADG